jgi:hypothetical protein
LPEPGSHLTDNERVAREKLVAAVAHKRANGMKPAEAVAERDVQAARFAGDRSGAPTSGEAI